jgi:hypothetical protein
VRLFGDEYSWAHKPDVKSFYETVVTNKISIISIFIVIVLISFLYVFPKSTLIAVVAGAALLLGTLLYISRHKYATADRPDDDHVRKVAATQLRPILNEMTAAGPLKKGMTRRYFYAFSLRVLHLVAPAVMNVPTVSNIRWLVTDNKKRLVFLPNYTNATDFYVRDFLNGTTPIGVNFMFTNGKGFPDAKMLWYGGISRDPEGYMHAVHSGQLVTDLWYAHEPNLTSDIIRKNRTIRNGLFIRMNENEARQWLRLL